MFLLRKVTSENFFLVGTKMEGFKEEYPNLGMRPTF